MVDLMIVRSTIFTLGTVDTLLSWPAYRVSTGQGWVMRNPKLGPQWARYHHGKRSKCHRIAGAKENNRITLFYRISVKRGREIWRLAT
jgi:hypothetical protein